MYNFNLSGIIYYAHSINRKSHRCVYNLYNIVLSFNSKRTTINELIDKEIMILLPNWRQMDGHDHRVSLLHHSSVCLCWLLLVIGYPLNNPNTLNNKQARSKYVYKHLKGLGYMFGWVVAIFPPRGSCCWQVLEPGKFWGVEVGVLKNL